MFQLQWVNEDLWMSENETINRKSPIKKTSVKSLLMFFWEEHCIECATPECFKSCVLYKERKDGRCARFVYGIFPNKNFKGHYDYGADITFRKWGKIEACLKFAYPINVRTIGRTITNMDFFSSRKELSERSEPENFSYDFFDEFIIECYLINNGPVTLVLEYFIDENRFRKTKFKQIFKLQKGHNFFHIPFREMNIDAFDGHLCLYPANFDEETRIIFVWLDFVKFRKKPKWLTENIVKTPEKVKCVAWDLDNTIWKGVLIEQDNVQINAEALTLIKKLDELGIIQTIVSKNNYDIGWKKLKDFNIEKYFLYPAINWEPKSVNLKRIAEQLNISLDSFAVIDDSPFERAEITHAYPNIRVYSESEIGNILKLEAFRVTVSADSQGRRLKYMSELDRNNIKNNFSGTYDQFLINCDMKVEAFKPRTDSDIERCFELIQRSNQLNLSTIRYTREEFNDLIGNKNNLCLAISCNDKFGDYGIIAFSSLKINIDVPILENLVISCRIAQKKVEQTYLQAILKLLKKRGFKKLIVKLIQTDKNGPLIKIFSDLLFDLEERTENTNILSISVEENVIDKKIMEFHLDESE